MADKFKLNTHYLNQGINRELDKRNIYVSNAEKKEAYNTLFPDLSVYDHTISAPWYNDSVERVAFNLYAMNIEEVNEIAEQIVTTLPYSEIEGIEIEDIKYSFNVDDATAQAVYNRVWELID